MVFRGGCSGKNATVYTPPYSAVFPLRWDYYPNYAWQVPQESTSMVLLGGFEPSTNKGFWVAAILEKNCCNTKGILDPPTPNLHVENL